MQSKKQIILFVLEILERRTDKSHPMTQTEITSEVSKFFTCERKTVCRNIKFLKEMGYPI